MQIASMHTTQSHGPSHPLNCCRRPRVAVPAVQDSDQKRTKFQESRLEDPVTQEALDIARDQRKFLDYSEAPAPKTKGFGKSRQVGKVFWPKPIKVLDYPDPRLRKENKEVALFDRSLKELAMEMFDQMYLDNGIGLAAPQVGANIRLMVFNELGPEGRGSDKHEIVLVNPKVVSYSDRYNSLWEGCLSFPGVGGDIIRPESITVSATDLNGKTFNLKLSGYKARIFQHEYDHLEGILFQDRMSDEVFESNREVLLELEKKFESQYTNKFDSCVAKRGSVRVRNPDQKKSWV